ncbi:FAD binding domain in molybdopterin dehydrogenase family protein [Mycobacterium xenopi 3993]|nr:FAD binding domain in molybdopterin dehydrogenase family protein [Mycobacterium xenopi 3993]
MLLTTDLTISGKAAQFGRGVLADVATNLVGQFAKRLEAELLGETAGKLTHETASAATLSTSVEQESVDLVKVVALPLAKRVAPVIAASPPDGDRLPAGRRRHTHTRPRCWPTSCGRAVAAAVMKAARSPITASSRSNRPWTSSTSTAMRRRSWPAPEPGADAGHAPDPLREPGRHFSRRRARRHRPARRRGARHCGHPARVRRNGRRGRRGSAAAYPGHTADRALPDPQPGHARGAIAHADPAAEYGAVALALGARMEAVSSAGSREIAADDFFTGLWRTRFSPTKY